MIMHRFFVISLLVVYFKITRLQTSHLINILQKETNFFHKINSQLHSITNQVFQSLNLNKELTISTKFQGLVMMHHDLNTLAEIYSNIFKDIKNKTRTAVNWKNSTNLEKLFEDILNEEIPWLSYDLASANNTRSSTANDLTDGEFKSVVSELLRKVKGITLEDIVRSMVNKTHQTIEDKIKLRTKNRDIKIWQDNQANNTRRIYKGKRSRISKYPFLASVHVMQDFVCAGSIISKNLVITAASCLQMAHNNTLSYKNPRLMFVRVGSDSTRHSGELIPITQIYFHPAYDPVTLDNNLAIVRVMKRLRFKKRKIRRILVGDIDDNADVVTVMGWGARDAKHDKRHSDKFSFAKLDIYKSKECEKVYSRYYVNDKNFCAGFESQGGGACNRDVGGPAIASGELVGIISFGPPVCGMSDAPTVFTRVGYYVDWIYGIINQNLQLRNYVIVSSTSSKKPAKAFPMPPLVTSSANPEETDLPHFVTTTTEAAYPEEDLILKEILQEIVLSNTSIIDYILYGDSMLDEYESKIIRTTKIIDANHHPLRNESLFLFERNNDVQENKNKKKIKINPMNRGGSESFKKESQKVKLLDHLVRFTQLNTKSQNKLGIKRTLGTFKTTTSINKLKQSQSRQNIDDDDDNKNDLNDSSSYYEGISIETKKPINSKVDNYFDRKPTQKSTDIKLKNFKNIIFNVNLKKEGRNILRLDNENLKDLIFKKNIEKNFKYDKSVERVNEPVRYKTVKNAKLGHLAVVIPISNKGYENSDRKLDKYFDTKIHTKKPMQWRNDEFRD